MRKALLLHIAFLKLKTISLWGMLVNTALPARRKSSVTKKNLTAHEKQPYLALNLYLKYKSKQEGLPIHTLTLSLQLALTQHVCPLDLFTHSLQVFEAAEILNTTSFSGQIHPYYYTSGS